MRRAVKVSQIIRALGLAALACVAPARTGHAQSINSPGRVSTGPGGAEAQGVSLSPSTSTNGQYVAYESGAGNIVSDDGNSSSDIFVRNTLSGTTSRISVID